MWKAGCLTTFSRDGKLTRQIYFKSHRWTSKTAARREGFQEEKKFTSWLTACTETWRCQSCFNYGKKDHPADFPERKKRIQKILVLYGASSSVFVLRSLIRRSCSMDLITARLNPLSACFGLNLAPKFPCRLRIICCFQSAWYCRHLRLAANFVDWRDEPSETFVATKQHLAKKYVLSLQTCCKFKC